MQISRLGGHDFSRSQLKNTSDHLQKVMITHISNILKAFYKRMIELEATVLDRLEDPNSNPNPPKCRKGSIRENDEFSEKMKSFSTFLVGTETSIFLKKLKNMFNMNI